MVRPACRQAGHLFCKQGVLSSNLRGGSSYMKKIHLGKINWDKYLLDSERSGIRSILVSEPEEVKRLLEMEDDPEISRFIIGDKLKDEADVVDFALATSTYVPLAVAGKMGHVEEYEVNRLQGWVSVYDDNHKRVKRLMASSLLPQADRYLEVGFARYTHAKSGQMAAALRQVVYGLVEEHKKCNQSLLIVGYAQEGNEPSERVLKASGFEKVGKAKYTLKAKILDTIFIYKAVVQ